MASFKGLFDFPDLSDGQPELLCPSNSSNDENSDELIKGEENA